MCLSKCNVRRYSVALYVMLYWNESFRDHPGSKDVDRAHGGAVQVGWWLERTWPGFNP
jgi:hypothetical protein